MAASTDPTRSTPTAGSRGRGFTLIEMMITLTMVALVIGALATILLGTLRSKTGALNRIESSQAARTGLDLIARDVRCAGYGADLDYTANPQPAIAYID